MAKYIVTGATSFIGKAVVNELLKRNYEVIVIARPQSEKKKIFENFHNCRIVLEDMCNVDVWKKEICTADYFMHLGWDGIGAKGRSDKALQIRNVNTAIDCMKAATDLGCKKFMFAGSQAEYGVKYELIGEDALCEPVTEYGKAKLNVFKRGMSLAEKLGMVYYHTRIFSVYGPGDHPWTLVSSCVKHFKNDEEIKTSSGEQFWNFMYVDDAAKVLVDLMESNAKSGSYNIASEDTRKLKDFIQEIYNCCNRNGKVCFGSFNPVEKQGNLIPDITKLKAEIKYIPETSFHDGIMKIIEQISGEGTR